MHTEINMSFPSCGFVVETTERRRAHEAHGCFLNLRFIPSSIDVMCMLQSCVFKHCMDPVTSVKVPWRHHQSHLTQVEMKELIPI